MRLLNSRSEYSRCSLPRLIVEDSYEKAVSDMDTEKEEERISKEHANEREPAADSRVVLHFNPCVITIQVNSCQVLDPPKPPYNYGTVCKLNKMQASSWNCMQAHGTVCNLEIGRISN